MPIVNARWANAEQTEIAAERDGVRMIIPAEHPDVEEIKGRIAAFVEAPPDLPALAAAARWQKEVGGIKVAGVPIATDDRSKILIHGARTRAEKNPDCITPFSAADGQTYELEAPQIIAISDAVAEHVAACFDVQAGVLGLIAAGAITTPEEIAAAFA